MPKTWEQMTTEEKVEDLRRGVDRMTETVNLRIEQQKRLAVFHNDSMNNHTRTSSPLAEVAEALKILELRVQKLDS
jgi:ornithine carbamoyltransferase